MEHLINTLSLIMFCSLIYSETFAENNYRKNDFDCEVKTCGVPTCLVSTNYFNRMFFRISEAVSLSMGCGRDYFYAKDDTCTILPSFPTADLLNQLISECSIQPKIDSAATIIAMLHDVGTLFRAIQELELIRIKKQDQRWLFSVIASVENGVDDHTVSRYYHYDFIMCPETGVLSFTSKECSMGSKENIIFTRECP